MSSQKTLPILKLLATEIGVSFLIGGAPILIAYLKSGVEGINSLLSSLLPSDELVGWSFVLTVVAFIFIFLNRFFLKTSDLGNRIWSHIDDVSSQVAPSVLTILRIGAGVMLTFICLWAIADYSSFSAPKATYFLIYGLIALAEAVSLRWLQELMENKWPRRTGYAAL